MTEEQQFVDAESYGHGFSKKKISFKDVVILHLKKIGEFASCEWRGGYWLKKPHPDSNRNDTIDTYIEDTSERYSNAVEYLHDLLFPYFDKDMKEASKSTEQDLKDTYKKNVKDSFVQADKITYRLERVKICRRLFRELCCFLYRKKYLELGKADD